ncbi:MAG: hypothetical protein ACRESZ_02540 [Methylococcales bacterium]
MNNKSIIYTLTLSAGFCAATISFLAPLFPYGVDSAGYIDQARSIMARGAFEVNPYNKWGAGVSPGPAKLFPPGYPLLIVTGSIVSQLPVEVVAPFLSLAALILLPLVIVFSFHRILGLWPAFWIAILVVLTPAAVKYGYVAYSDTPSLVWVIYAVNRLLVADNRPAPWFFLGLLTGFAYLIRNANLGLLPSISLYLLWCFIIEPGNRKETIKNGFVWLATNALIIVPWLIRNILVFGKLQPYWMHPSSVSLGENIHDYLRSQLDTLLAFRYLDTLLTADPWGFILLLMLVAVLTHQVIATWRNWQKIEQKTFFISVAHAVIGAAIVIAARTRYEWGVHIIVRYALPYSCFVFVALFIVLKNTTFKINRRNFGFGVAITLLLIRFYELPVLYKYNNYQQRIMEMAKTIKDNKAVMCNYSDGRIIISNDAYVYRILCAEP